MLRLTSESGVEVLTVFGEKGVRVEALMAQLVREGGLPPALAAETFGAPIFEPLRDDRASLRAWAESTKPDDPTATRIRNASLMRKRYRSSRTEEKKKHRSGI